MLDIYFFMSIINIVVIIFKERIVSKVLDRLVIEDERIDSKLGWQKDGEYYCVYLAEGWANGETSTIYGATVKEILYDLKHSVERGEWH